MASYGIVFIVITSNYVQNVTNQKIPNYLTSIKNRIKKQHWYVRFVLDLHTRHVIMYLKMCWIHKIIISKIKIILYVSIVLNNLDSNMCYLSIEFKKNNKFFIILLAWILDLLYIVDGLIKIRLNWHLGKINLEYLIKSKSLKCLVLIELSGWKFHNI